jgi:hypothetical protein
MLHYSILAPMNSSLDATRQTRRGCMTITAGHQRGCPQKSQRNILMLTSTVKNVRRPTSQTACYRPAL